ncbi:MAG: DUF188 domain-containing protein [Peptococcia bacterium]
MNRVIVDADGCPRTVRQIIAELTSLYGWEMVTVASPAHIIEDSPHHIVGGLEPQAVDLIIHNMVRSGDIVVTQDWGLAALVLGKGAGAISPSGMLYKDEKMDFLLEERHLKAKYRQSGGHTKGAAPRTKRDDQRFRTSLEKLLEN